MSLQPWTDPVCTLDGTIYDLGALALLFAPDLRCLLALLFAALPFFLTISISQHYEVAEAAQGGPRERRADEGGRPCPAALSPRGVGCAALCVPLLLRALSSSLSPLSAGPVTYKEFTDYSHIVAVRQSGHVYAWEAIEQLNVKAKNWKDLVSGEPFTRKDVLTLQDPTDANKGNVQLFYHVKHGLSAQSERREQSRADAHDPLRNISSSSIAPAVALKLRALQVPRAPPREILRYRLCAVTGGGGAETARRGRGRGQGQGQGEGGEQRRQQRLLHVEQLRAQGRAQRHPATCASSMRT